MKISIVTPVLNGRDYIAGCIASVASQTHRDVEHIVVDGGSVDGTIEMLRENDHRLARWVSGEDSGVYDAMNRGIEMASGDVVGILGADDMLARPSALECIAHTMADPALDGCYSDLEYVQRSDGKKVIRYWRSCEYIEGMLDAGWIPPHPTFYVRRDVYSKYGVYDVAYKLAADYELMLRFISKHKLRLHYIPGPLVRMRLGGMTNRTLFNVILQNIEIMRAWRQSRDVFACLSFMAKRMKIKIRQYSEDASSNA